MPRFNIVKKSTVKETSRLIQLYGLFDLQPKKEISESWNVDCPIEDFSWNVGLIVGSSGSGKTTVAKEMFEEQFFLKEFNWDAEKSLVDSFPENMGIKEITEILSSVGFSSPPCWLKPFHALSNGEQFRVNMARILAENKTIAVVDEFTSVVDRTVAKIGSFAISKSVRKRNQKFVVISCHFDIAEWLEPDWIYEPASNKFTRGLLRRPKIELEIIAVKNEAWKFFSKYHYLNTGKVNPTARSFMALWDGIPVAFTSVMFFQHPKTNAWREHRTVCLPDYQGMGIGNKLSEYIASLYLATGKPFISTTANPSMVKCRAKSKLWKMKYAPKLNRSRNSKNKKTEAANRYVASFEFLGMPNKNDAKGFEII